MIGDFATSIKSFIDGDKNADTHSWDGKLAYLMDNYSANDAANWEKSNWSVLRSVNYYLDNMRKASADPAVLDHYEGVGRLFRAMFYYDKIKLFGAVPWYETSIDPTDYTALYKDRDSRDYVAEKVLEDINYACEHCSTDAKYRSHASYFHRYVALAFKARFCLFEGTMRKYHANDPSTGKPWARDESRRYLEACIDACEQLMASGIYRLSDNPNRRETQYRDMFTCADGISSYSDEFIWAREYDIDLKVTYAINDYMVNVQHASYAFTRQFINTYLMRDGSPFTTRFADYDSVPFELECKDRDYRLTQTIRHPGFTRGGGTVRYAPDLGFSKTGYQPIKWLTDDYTKDSNVSAIATDVPLMRYAEVLLDYAEAKAELGEMTEEVWDKTIKPLRERAGVVSIYPTEADPYMAAYFQGRVTDRFILEVRRERGIELVMENQRWYDIMRWRQGELLAREWKGIYIPAVDMPLDLDLDGKAETVVTADKNFSGSLTTLYIDAASDAGHRLSNGTSGNIIPFTKNERTWRDYKYVRPIPTTALQANKNLTQNPEW